MESQKRRTNHNFVTIGSENTKVLSFLDAERIFSQSCHIEAGREAVCLILASDKQSHRALPSGATD
ncbi:MAG TPA: hypothetical protein DCK85_00350 [Ktedonobacter sp.]|nr:hypothetical protein [Ktedonobacter sp.]